MKVYSGGIEGKHVSIATLIAVFSFTATFWLFGTSDSPHHGTERLVACMQPTDDPTYAAKCLHTAIAQLLNRYTTREVQAITVATTSPGMLTAQCHPIGHIIGEETFKRSNSLEEALSRCSSACRASCTHGALGAGVLKELGEEYAQEDLAHVNNETLQRIGGVYCSRSVPLCHAIGHLGFILNGDGPMAFGVCDSASTGFAREACYQGAFMERAGTSESLKPFEEFTPATRDGDYAYPCLSVAPAHRHACFQFLTEYQQALFEREGITSTSTKLKIARGVCEKLSGNDRASCFEGIGIQSRIFGYESLRSNELQKLCDQFDRLEDRSACSIGILPRFLFIEEVGLGYCYNIAEKARQTTCYRAAFQWMGDVAPELITQVCDNEYTTVCAEEYRIYKKIEKTLPDYRFGLYGER